MKKNIKSDEKMQFENKNCGDKALEVFELCKNVTLSFFDKYICKCCVYVHYTKKKRALEILKDFENINIHKDETPTPISYPSVCSLVLTDPKNPEDPKKLHDSLELFEPRESLKHLEYPEQKNEKNLCEIYHSNEQPETNNDWETFDKIVSMSESGPESENVLEPELVDVPVREQEEEIGQEQQEQEEEIRQEQHEQVEEIEKEQQEEIEQEQQEEEIEQEIDNEEFDSEDVESVDISNSGTPNSKTSEDKEWIMA